jgi:MICOS complex subunit MIC27
LYHFSEPKKIVHKKSKVAESIEDVSKSVREEVTKVTDFYENQRSKVEVHYVNFMKDTQHIRNYLQEEDNTLPRAGAIALSAFSGVILGIRGGFFRKLFYGTITGTGMAAVCYPKEAKKYATVAFNFAYGKRPNDENQKDLPKFPSSFSEVKDHVVGLYDSVFKK